MADIEIPASSRARHRQSRCHKGFGWRQTIVVDKYGVIIGGHTRLLAAKKLRLKHKPGSYPSAGQLQQRPSPLGGGIFKRHWWRYWQPPGANLPPIVVQLPDGSYQSIHAVYRPMQGVEQIESWDCAFKDLETSDFVIGHVWGRVSRPPILGISFPFVAVSDRSSAWRSAHYYRLQRDAASRAAWIFADYTGYFPSC